MFKIKIGFLTAQKLTLDPKKWFTMLISNVICFFSGKFSHCLCVYEFEGIEYVREMNFVGMENYMKLTDYLKKYKDRIVIVTTSVKNRAEYNYRCKYEKAKYDFLNLMFFQLIKAITGKFFGKQTRFRRQCAEDTARMLNLDNAESYTPTELYNKII